MCLFTSARTVAIVFARSAGSEAMYCAGVLTFDGGFMDSSSSRTKCITERFENQPAAEAVRKRTFRTAHPQCPWLRLLCCRQWLNLVHGDELRGIDPGVARRTVGSLLAFGAGFAQALQRKIGQGVGANVFADFLQRLVRRNQLALDWCVH